MELKSIKKPSKNRCEKRVAKTTPFPASPVEKYSHKTHKINKTHKASEENPHELGEESAEESAEGSMQRDKPPKLNTPWAPSGPERIYLN